MNLNNNTWEIAEALEAGTLSRSELEKVEQRRLADAAFAEELQECINLLKSLHGSSKQQHFRNTLKEIGNAQQPKRRKTITIQFPAYLVRTTAVAAGIALIASLINYTVLLSADGKHKEEYSTISREVEHIKKDVQKQKEQQKALLDSIHKKEIFTAPPAEARYTGTGFALTADGYFVTAYHVLNNGKGDFDSVYIESSTGKYDKASLVNVNKEADIAILKVSKKNFRFTEGELPYTFNTARAALSSGIYTLGYPTSDLVYSEGYISGRNGYDGNQLQYTLEMPAGHGQSGSPVLDRNGDIVGILTAIGSATQEKAYAVSTQAIIDLVHTIPDYKTLHLPRRNKVARLSREAQVTAMENYTFSVKVYKR